MRRRPYSVVLLDEVEKAHPKVFDILLQVLDDGRLTGRSGAHGRLRTGVLHPDLRPRWSYLVDPSTSADVKREQVMAVVRQSFRPKFLNRLDEVVMFDALTRDELTHIVDLQVALLAERLQVRRITLDVTPEALESLRRTGYDRAYGARPLRRLVLSAIGDPLARMLLSGEVLDGARCVSLAVTRWSCRHGLRPGTSGVVTAARPRRSVPRGRWEA